jgi:hypothetical protein
MSLALEILTLVIGAVAMALVLPRAPRLPVGPQASRPVRPADLERVESIVTARSVASGVHTTLRPLLVEIAATRLGRRRALTPADAKALLGDELWDLLRPDRPRPEDPAGPGLSVDQLEQMTWRLEQL